MNIDEHTQIGVCTIEGYPSPSCAEFTPSTFPSGQSTNSVVPLRSGVSIKNALSVRVTKQTDMSHWYVLRATYGRELNAYNYLISRGVEAFCPTIRVVEMRGGKRKTVTKSRFPNMLFAYGPEEQLKKFVYDNVNLPYLRFYYEHKHANYKIEKVPLVVPDLQMESLKIICETDCEDVIMSATTIAKFETGQLVRVIAGPFCGVIGRVARYQGQQRVAIRINDLFTMCTAYIPSAFIEIV